VVHKLQRETQRERQKEGGYDMEENDEEDSPRWLGHTLKTRLTVGELEDTYPTIGTPTAFFLLDVSLTGPNISQPLIT
jgi:hypothetical protein